MARRIRRIGFVGLGRMGLPMACRLASAGFEVRGFDLAEPARAAFARALAARAGITGSPGSPGSLGSSGGAGCSGGAGITGSSGSFGGAADGTVPSGPADTLAGAAEDADAVVLMLPGSTVIAAVARDQGLLSAMRPETLLIDMSPAPPAGTGGPGRTDELARSAVARGIHVVGAPVSGGRSGAADGTLTILAGGAARAVARARPVLEALGSPVLHVGDAAGAGHARMARWLGVATD